jgi:TRAP-type mannitol/chloroaromatic compound transport system substrate-binding protein
VAQPLPQTHQGLGEPQSHSARVLAPRLNENFVILDSVLKAMREISREVTAENGSGDKITRKIYASYQQFRNLITDWSDISERAVLNSRVV